MGNERKAKLVGRINKIASLFGRFAAFRKRINKEMEGKYSPSLIALIAAAGAAFLMVFMLFVPNYLGVGDDSSFARVMSAANIDYISEATEHQNEFFTRVYTHTSLSNDSTEKEITGSQVMLVKMAVWLDNLITGDRFFDIRVLALLYGILCIPAIYLLIWQACMQVKQFSEGIVIGIVGVIIFADVAYMVYFNSLYPEALWFICLLYLVGAAISFQESRRMLKDVGYLALFAAAAIVLMTSRGECAFVGIVAALYCLRLLFARKDFQWKVICVMTGICLSFISIGCMVWLEGDYDEADKFHAMTRGVLFGSDDPAKTLEEFGINPSYELLADASLYEYIPAAQLDEAVIQEEFLSQYTTADIGKYYIRHPGKFVRMLDVAIKSCFGIRRDYCGNYERSAGLPARAKSIFWSAWSTFKSSSAPKTIGYLGVLIGAVIFLSGKSYTLRPEEDRRGTVFLDSMMVLVLIIVIQAGITIVNSGDAEMIQHCFMVSCGMDVMTYFVFAQIAHKLSIF